MFNVSTFRNGAIALVLMTMVAPSFAKQALGHGHDHQAPSKVVVVKPDYRPSYKAPSHRSYHHSGLPSTAAILAIAELRMRLSITLITSKVVTSIFMLSNHLYPRHSKSIP
ncbi:hypothetical protein P4S64_13045 [Vibrio sp. M60_M31a]